MSRLIYIQNRIVAYGRIRSYYRNDLPNNFQLLFFNHSYLNNRTCIREISIVRLKPFKIDFEKKFVESTSLESFHRSNIRRKKRESSQFPTLACFTRVKTLSPRAHATFVTNACGLRVTRRARPFSMPVNGCDS